MIETVKPTRPVTKNDGEYAHDYTGPQPLEWPDDNIPAKEYDPEAFDSLDAPKAPGIPPEIDGKRTFISEALGRIASKFIRRSEQVDKIVKMRGKMVTMTGKEGVALDPDAPARDWRKLHRLRDKTDRLYFKQKRLLNRKHTLVGRSESTDGLTDMKQIGKNAYYQKGRKQLEKFEEPRIRGGTYYYNAGNQTRSVHYTYNEPALLPIDPENMSKDMIKKIEAENKKRLEESRAETIKKLEQELSRRDPNGPVDYRNPVDARTHPFDPPIIKNVNDSVDASMDRRRKKDSRDNELTSIYGEILKSEVNGEDRRKLKLGRDGLSLELQRLVDTGKMSPAEAASELDRIDAIGFELDRRTGQLYNEREDHEHAVEMEMERLLGRPLDHEDWEILSFSKEEKEAREKALKASLVKGDISQSDYDDEISRIDEILKLERETEEKFHIEAIAADASHKKEFDSIRVRVIDKYIGAKIDKINERVKRKTKNRTITPADFEDAEKQKNDLWRDGRLLILSDSELRKELQSRVNDGKLAAVKLPDEMSRIKALRRSILPADFTDILKQDFQRYKKLKSDRSRLVNQLLSSGLEVGKDINGTPKLETYDKPLPDLDNPDDAIRRISTEPYSPWKKRSEAKQLRKWLRIHRKTQKLNEKRQKILRGEDWRAKRIGFRAKTHMRIARRAYGAQERVDAAHKKALDMRENARQKYTNFKNGELDIPSIHNLDLTPEARHRFLNPRSQAGANVLPRTSRRGILWEAAKGKAGQKTGKAIDKTKEKLKAARDWPANPKLEKVDGLNIPRSEPKARNPNLEPRYPANTEPPANRLPRTNRPGEAIKKIKRKAAYHRKIAKNIKKGELDKIQDLDLRS